MSNYRKGRDHEYRVANKLRKQGWLVIRSAGSHSIFDLVAIKDSAWLFNNETGPVGGEGEILLIQVKSGRSKERAIKKVLDSDIERYTGLYNVTVKVQ